MAAWRKHAQHAVASLADLAQPVHQIIIPGFYGDSADDTIYKFDQCMARMGVDYFAECTGRRHHWVVKVWVPADKSPDVQEIIARIRT